MDRCLFGLSDNFYVVNLISDRVYSLFCLFWPQIKIVLCTEEDQFFRMENRPGGKRRGTKKALVANSGLHSRC